MLLPMTCPVCGEAGAAPCAGCLADLHPAPVLPAPPHVDACHALLSYEGTGRELVARLKYRNRRVALPGLAAASARLVDPEGIDAVTWAPTTSARRLDRGYDQSQLLARRVAAHLRRPCRRLLDRAAGAPQTGRSAADRWGGPGFTARGVVRGRVLLVDDVVTTGATTSAAAAALRSAGATAVVVLALARTPVKVAPERVDG